jgi:hypothetical protein
MKHFRWMAALAAATLFLAACGSMQDAGLETEVRPAAQPFDDIAATPENSTPAYWEGETGVTDFGGYCFFVREEPSETDFVVYHPYDPKTDTHYAWTLLVVTMDETHYLFPDPVEGEVLQTGLVEPGYDTVIGCKVPEEPEEEEGGEWCSPGYWRQPHHLDSWEVTAYATDDLFVDELGYLPTRSSQGVRQGAPESPTLLQVLQKPQWYGGDAFNAVGDLLSMSHPDVDFGGERVEDSCPLN